MVIELSYEELKEILVDYYSKKYEGYTVEVKCYSVVTKESDGWGFYDDVYVASAFVDISREMDVLGKKRIISNREYIYQEEIVKIVSEKLQEENQNLKYMSADKSKVSIGIEKEKVLKKTLVK